LKVLELDFLKRCDRTSDCYHQMRFLGSIMPQKCVSGPGSANRTPLGPQTGPRWRSLQRFPRLPSWIMIWEGRFACLCL